MKPRRASTRFVIVSLMAGERHWRVWPAGDRSGVYLVEARMLSTVPGANVNAAAARIDVLLEDQPLTVAGFTWMTLHREEPIGITEVDAVEPSIRWFRRGGRYRSEMSHTGGITKETHMAIISGRHGQVLWDPAGTTPVEIISLNAWTADFKTEYEDVTCFGDVNRVYIPGMKDAERHARRLLQLRRAGAV